MRLLICDPELDMAHLIEIVATRQGHEVVGIADTFQAADVLIGATHPDIVVLDPALGYGTDFDLLDEATVAGARVIVFSRTAHDFALDRYDPVPLAVDKPELGVLEEVLRTIEAATPRVVSDDRRVRPQRDASGRRPVGPEDHEAFFEAISGAGGGDVLVWIDFSAVFQQMDAAAVHQLIAGAARQGDRLVLSPTSIRGFLPGAGADGVRSFWARLDERELLLPGVTVQAVILNDGEHPNDAFDRLRRTADPARP